MIPVYYTTYYTVIQLLATYSSDMKHAVYHGPHKWGLRHYNGYHHHHHQVMFSLLHILELKDTVNVR